MNRFIGLSAAACVLAVVAFWATLVTDPPKTEAEVMVTYDLGEVLKAAPKDVPLQDGSVVACTYVLKDGHRCD